MEKNSHKKNKSILLLGASFITLGCVLAVTSLAWFCPPQSKASVTRLTGKATGSYFEGGTGVEGDPYIIATPKQLYYFNWLQDLGYFNKDEKGATDSSGKETGDGIIDTAYFKIEPKDGSKELDMSNYVLPPAGTSEYPFVGNFDGNEVVLKEVTITNSYDELNTDGKRPGTASEDSDVSGILSGAEIVGFFGIIGQYETTISYGTSTNAVKDLYFDNLTVKSAASSVLAGFIAGYANGAIDNCGIHCGQFSFVSGAKGLTDGKNISEYTLIGDYGSNFEWEGQPGQDTSGGGTGNDWGSSIDMMTLSKRMNYIMGGDSSSAYASNYYKVSSDSYGLYAGARKTGTEEPKWSRENTTNWYVYDGTYLPLNVNTTTAFSGGEIDGNTLNSIAFRTTEFYQTNTSEDSIIAKNNSGYLIGGSSSSSLGDIRVRFMRLNTLKEGNTTIYGGLRNSVPSGVQSYDGDQITIYSVDTRSGTTSAEINLTNYESTFGYTRFKDVKTNFDKTMTGYSVVHGFKFMQISVESSNYAAPRKATINNVAYPNYQFLKGALNFTVKKSGDITALLGSYYSDYTPQTMFDLYKITRDGNNNIVSADRIDKVYKNNGSDAKTNPYVYTTDSETASNNGDLLFDFSKVTGTACLEVCKAYYFEIPVNAGDYAICKTQDDVAAYLMYLDIGANAGDEGEGQKTIDSTNIDFVYETSDTVNGLAQISAEGYKPSGVVFSISGSLSDASKLLYFKRDGSANTGTGVKGVLYYTLSGLTIKPAGNGVSTNEDPNKQTDS